MYHAERLRAACFKYLLKQSEEKGQLPAEIAEQLTPEVVEEVAEILKSKQSLKAPSPLLTLLRPGEEAKGKEGGGGAGGSEPMNVEEKEKQEKTDQQRGRFMGNISLDAPVPLPHFSLWTSSPLPEGVTVPVGAYFQYSILTLSLVPISLLL